MDRPHALSTCAESLGSSRNFSHEGGAYLHKLELTLTNYTTYNRCKIAFTKINKSVIVCNADAIRASSEASAMHHWKILLRTFLSQLEIRIPRS